MRFPTTPTFFTRNRSLFICRRLNDRVWVLLRMMMMMMMRRKRSRQHRMSKRWQILTMIPTTNTILRRNRKREKIVGKLRSREGKIGRWRMWREKPIMRRRAHTRCHPVLMLMLRRRRRTRYHNRLRTWVGVRLDAAQTTVSPGPCVVGRRWSGMGSRARWVRDRDIEDIVGVRKREVIAKVEVGSGKPGVGVVVHDNPFLPPSPSLFLPISPPPRGLSANSIPIGTVTHTGL